jgi:hypothetical protein
MEIFTRLFLDAILFLAFLLSTFAIDYILIALFGGMFKLKSLSFGIYLNKPLYYDFYSVLVFGSVVTFLTSPLLIISYFFSRFFYSLNHFFDLYDVASISLMVFIFMFLYMGGSDIFINIETMTNYKESGYSTRTLWEEIDLSLTPAIIHTLLVVLGMLITYYQFK